MLKELGGKKKYRVELHPPFSLVSPLAEYEEKKLSPKKNNKQHAKIVHCPMFQTHEKQTHRNLTKNYNKKCENNLLYPH